MALVGVRSPSPATSEALTTVLIWRVRCRFTGFTLQHKCCFIRHFVVVRVDSSMQTSLPACMESGEEEFRRGVGPEK